MAKNLHPPEKLLFCGNLKENFRKFKQQFDIYITAAGIKDKTEDIKCATLLLVIGQDAVEIFNTFKWKYSSVFRENRCPPPPKPVYDGNFSHEAVTLKIRSRSPESNKLLILSDLYRLANLVTFHPMVMR